MIENHHDWKIHKILDEAKRVYIYPARGNNKVYTQLELYADLVTQNKNVQVIRVEDVKKAVDFSEALIDKDLYYHHEPPWLKDALDRYFEGEMKKWLGDYRITWEPKIIHGTSIVDDPFWKYRDAWFGLYDGFIVSSEMEETE